MTLQERIKFISRELKLSHVGSCLTAANIISDIYFDKKKDEPFILSSGHAALALYCVLEQYEGKDAEGLYHKHGTHPNRDLSDGIWCSTGSLGMGLGISVGMAIADRSRNVHVLISDGESFEGILWEVANVKFKYDLFNLKIHMNYNGWSATERVSLHHVNRVKAMFPDMKVHYTTVTDYVLS